MITVLLALVLGSQPAKFDAQSVKDWRDLCVGPVEAVIPDDDPGLRFYRDLPPQDAKRALAINRAGCGPELRRELSGSNINEGEAR